MKLEFIRWDGQKVATFYGRDLAAEGLARMGVRYIEDCDGGAVQISALVEENGWVSDSMLAKGANLFCERDGQYMVPEKRNDGAIYIHSGREYGIRVDYMGKLVGV